MSRAYDAKRLTIQAYPDNKEEGIRLFLGYIDMSESDFIYEFNQTPEEYIYALPKETK